MPTPSLGSAFAASPATTVGVRVGVFWGEGMSVLAVRLAGVVVGAMPEHVMDVLLACSVAEVFDPVVGRVAIQMADIVVGRTWANECFHHKVVDVLR